MHPCYPHCAHRFSDDEEQGDIEKTLRPSYNSDDAFAPILHHAPHVRSQEEFRREKLNQRRSIF